MHISVLFNYTESVIPPRCRKPRTVTRDDGKVDVSIPVLTGDQAPVAIRVTGNFIGRDQAFSYELRWWEGQLWSPISLDHVFEPRGRTTGQDNWDWPELPEVVDLRNGGRNLCHTYDFQGTYGSNPIEDVEADIHAFACAFHAIRPPSPPTSGHPFHAHPARQSERSDAGLHC